MTIAAIEQQALKQTEKTMRILDLARTLEAENIELRAAVADKQKELDRLNAHVIKLTERTAQLESELANRD